MPSLHGAAGVIEGDPRPEHPAAPAALMWQMSWVLAIFSPHLPSLPQCCLLGLLLLAPFSIFSSRQAGKLRGQNILCAILQSLHLSCVFLPPSLEKRTGGTSEENQQHLQHSWHHICPQHCQGPRPAHHLQECCCHRDGHQRAPQDAPLRGEAPRE